MSRPYILAESTWRAVAATSYEVAVLPWGATEPHNYHLPYGTDTIQCDAVAAEAARRAWEAGARVTVLPTVPFGVQTTQLDLRLALNVMPSTQLAILADLVSALEGHGVRKLVVLNGHGGNDFKAMLRELLPRTTLFLCAVNWWQVVDARPYFEVPGDHAGELETSVVQHVAPTLVRPVAEAGSGAERQPRIAALRERWAWSPRPWSKISADTGVGDPRAATAEKGARFLDAVSGRLAEFLVELAAADPARIYE
ncbi:creatininase family protein [Roseisolibacter sp. H3M3-2]|uniref:creatininase family protein n=1 Tax=Roseisolibacter sp. H3M3-2 TaxID=3031323 RepID=UPI0023DB0FC0|nr:creatininase family protein [Roseisolibacter sp. H3M3-2]MDF1501753.1 creatininase family protein [Roseisolibacter sp. H3M3-2]